MFNQQFWKYLLWRAEVVESGFSSRAKSCWQHCWASAVAVEVEQHNAFFQMASFLTNLTVKVAFHEYFSAVLITEYSQNSSTFASNMEAQAGLLPQFRAG